MDNGENGETQVPEALNIPIGEVVVAWREFRGLSLTELAAKSRLSKGYISQVEHNKIRRPGNQQLAKLADGLEIEVWDLMSRRLPGEKDGPDDENRQQATASPTTSRTNQGPKVRFGAGYAMVSSTSRSQADMLRDMLHHLEQIKLLVEELLHAQHDESIS